MSKPKRQQKETRSIPSTVPAPESADSSSDEVYSSSDEEQQVVEQVSRHSMDRVPGTIPRVPRSSHVSDKTREKIISGEYVKIVKLLPTLDDEEDKGEKIDRQLTFYQWLRCYRVLMSIRLQAYPDELQGMLRHEEIVQDLHAQNRDALAYDAQFRRLKEQHPVIQWGEYLSEVVMGLPSGPQPKSRLPLVNNRPAGRFPQMPQVALQPQRPVLTRPFSHPEPAVCAFFNTPRGCVKPPSLCGFAHKCRACGKVGHPVSRCFYTPARTDLPDRGSWFKGNRPG